MESWFHSKKTPLFLTDFSRIIEIYFVPKIYSQENYAIITTTAAYMH